MPGQDAIVGQIEEAIRRLETELAQLKNAVSHKRKDLGQHKKALNALAKSAARSPGTEE